ncbi:MAG TPA: V-type ATPase subunit [Blastocatellia bacterium]|nr:V-type ATPase subunit [Blastocatellia bacterium]
MYSGYDYGNARLRAMKSRLFTRRTYDEIAALPSVDALISWLARSTYSAEAEAALARYSGLRAVHEACRLRLANVMRSVLSFFSGDAARLVGILLAPWDLYNLKTIMRGQESGLPADEIVELLVPAGQLDDATLKTLARQRNANETAALLHTWNSPLAACVIAAQEARLETNDWSVLESTLDANFYQGLVARLNDRAQNDRIVREYLSRRIDVTNIIVAVRLRAGRPELPESFLRRQLLDGGSLSADSLLELISTRSPLDALGLLKDSRVGPALIGLDVLDPARLQALLERDFNSFSLRFLKRDPLTIATVIGFVAAQKIETLNIRLLGETVALGLGRTEFKKELIVH